MTRQIAAVSGALVLALGVVACGGGSATGAGSGGGHVNIVVWEGYQQTEATAIKRLTAEYNATHKNVTVTPVFIGNSDYALQKVETAIAAGNPPDISYLYGSWMANIATSPDIVTQNRFAAADPGFWNGFWRVEREVSTVGQTKVGVPALVDNLALVWNKKLFAQAHLAPPNPNWTWSDFARAAIALTNPAKKQFGWAYVNNGSEDTVWRYWALLWQSGGSILTADYKHAAFNSTAGIQALSFLQNLARHGAIYFDNGNGSYLGLFTSGHIGMLFTGPWDLSQIIAGKVDYGVTTLPGNLNHQTISGPDDWVVFNNGSARVNAAENFLKWFTSPPIDLQWGLMTGDLPVKPAVAQLPGYKQFLARYPGVGVWVQNLNNALQARPTLAAYPKISTQVGQAVEAVLLGKATPQAALNSAAQQVDAILAVPGG